MDHQQRRHRLGSRSLEMAIKKTLADGLLDTDCSVPECGPLREGGRDCRCAACVLDRCMVMHEHYVARELKKTQNSGVRPKAPLLVFTLLICVCRSGCALIAGMSFLTLISILSIGAPHRIF